MIRIGDIRSIKHIGIKMHWRDCWTSRVTAAKEAVIAAVLCMGLNTGALGQSASTFYDRATYTIRQIFDDPVRCAPGQHASQAWSEWSKCIAEGTERISRLFDYSPGVVRVVDDYKNKVQVIGQMIDDHILKRDDALKEIAAERDRLMKTLTPLIEGRVYREASGQR